MKNGVPCSVFRVLTVERPLMVTFNFTLLKEQDNNFFKATLVLSAEHIFTTKSINRTFSVLWREKQTKRTRQSISPKFQHPLKVLLNTKRTHPLTMILKLLTISQSLWSLPKNMVSCILSPSSDSFTFMKLALVSKFTKQESPQAQSSLLLEIMSMMGFWLWLKLAHFMAASLMKIN